MSDWLLAQVGEWGAMAVTLVTFLSCLAIPVPSSMMMLAAGAFAASGDLVLAEVVLAALLGAVAGDQVGYGLGRLGGRRAEGWLMQSPTRAAVLDRARLSMQRRGALAVFLTRWLFSVLGPYVNFLAGGAGMNWLRFTASGVAGEAIWVGVYTGLGHVAGGQVELIATTLGNATGLIASLAATLGLGWVLWHWRPHPGRGQA